MPRIATVLKLWIEICQEIRTDEDICPTTPAFRTPACTELFHPTRTNLTDPRDLATSSKVTQISAAAQQAQGHVRFAPEEAPKDEQNTLCANSLLFAPRILYSYVILRFHSLLLPPTPIPTWPGGSHDTSVLKRKPCTLGAQHLLQEAEQSAKGASRPSEAVRWVLLTLSPQRFPDVYVPVNSRQNQASLPSKCCVPWLLQRRRELPNCFQWAEAKHCSAWWGPWIAKDTEIPSHFHNASNSTGFY